MASKWEGKQETATMYIGKVKALVDEGMVMTKPVWYLTVEGVMGVKIYGFY